MKDFNFFEPYLNKGRQRSAVAVRSGLVVLVSAALLFAWPLFNFGYGLMLQRQTAQLQSEVTGSDKYPLLAAAKEAEAAVVKLQAHLNSLDSTDQTLEAGEWLTEPFLYSIVSAVPKDVKLDSLSVQTGKKVSLTGTATGKPAIAELSLNIRATDRFEGLYISSISNKDGSYSFDMSFSVKDGES
ncbi:MAG TPA: PilN domain-containing protein [Terriglobales bacterium]|nr:PilN domain-containing protein [Terriglobales bacterium]